MITLEFLLSEYQNKKIEFIEEINTEFPKCPVKHNGRPSIHAELINLRIQDCD